MTVQVQMEFNPTKYYTMCFSLKREPPLAKFSYCDKFLENIKSHPKLGVEIDNRLRWKDKINQIFNAANRMLSLVFDTIRRASKRCSV